jgi:hypothetical protein
MADESASRKDAFVSFSVIAFVDREIEKERLLTTSERERLREVILEKFNALAKANDLAYIELQRRLDNLNHAHENMVKDREQLLRIDVHEAFYKEYGVARDEINKKIANIEGRGQATIIILGLLFAALQVALHFWQAAPK